MKVAASSDLHVRHRGMCWARVSFRVCALALLLQPWVALAASMDEPMEFDIPRNEALEDALIGWGVKAGMTVMINTKVLAGRVTNGLHGKFSARTALDMLLGEADLSYTEEGGRVRIIRKSHSEILRQTRWENPDSYAESTAISDGPQNRESDETSNQTYEDGKKLEEVVVTAEKREERLQDVPIPVTAISAPELVENGLLRLQDFYTQAPSVSIQEGVQSNQSITIRGLLGATTYLDDVPIAGTVPDIDPGNLARIEILRGPQGTLYGASGLGGVVKYVTADPSTEGVTGRVEAGTNTVYNGYDLGYNFRSSANLPVTSDLAVRVGAFWRQDAGYIDNPLLGIDGVNRDTAKGGQVTALWKPAEFLSVRFNALYQDIQGGNQDAAVINGLTGRPLGDLQEEYVAGVGPYDRQVKAYNLIVKANLGVINVALLTGYTSNGFHDYLDYSPVFESIVENDFGVNGAPVFTSRDDKSLSEELRFSGSIGKIVDWLVGGYYDHVKTSFFDEVLATNATTGAIAGTEIFFSTPSLYNEYATFSNLTIHITDQFDVQLGGRQSWDNTSGPNNVYYGPLEVEDGCGSYTCPQPNYPSQSHDFTYLFTPQFKFTRDLMAYIRLASAYVPGGVNPNGLPGTPPTYAPEKTENYDIGTKGSFFDNALSFDVSLYRINFLGIQNEFQNPSTYLTYTANAGSARSQGLEVSMQAKPVTGLDTSAWVVFSNAYLTNIPYGVILAGVPERVGDQLPDSDRFSANFSFNYQFPIVSELAGFFGGEVSYIGERAGPYAAAPRVTYPAYSKTDVRAGIKHDSWTINAYVGNVTDRRGIVSSDAQSMIVMPPQTAPYNRYYIQPRTIGISVARTF